MDFVQVLPKGLLLMKVQYSYSFRAVPYQGHAFYVFESNRIFSYRSLGNCVYLDWSIDNANSMEYV